MTIDERLSEIEQRENEILHFFQMANIKNNNTSRDIIQELINSCQIREEKLNGKYVIYSESLEKFVKWIFDNSYDLFIHPQFINENFRTKDKEVFTLGTIKKYFQKYSENLE